MTHDPGGKVRPNMHLVNFTAESIVDALNRLSDLEQCLVLATLNATWLAAHPQSEWNDAWGEMTRLAAGGAASHQRAA